MKLYDVKNTEEYWTKAVEDFFKLGFRHATVPAANVGYDTVKAIAAKLKVDVEVKNATYVFHRNGVINRIP